MGKSSNWAKQKMSRPAEVSAQRLAARLAHLPVLVYQIGNKVKTECGCCGWTTHTGDVAVIEDHAASH